MGMSRKSAKPAGADLPAPGFGEAAAWAPVGAGWCPLFGRFGELGFSFEWHDFLLSQPFDWARSFHPGSVELCLNLAGSGCVRDERQAVDIAPRQIAYYHQSEPPLSATREVGQRHQFITVEFSAGFLSSRLGSQAEHLHPLVRGLVRQGRMPSGVVTVENPRLGLLQVIEALRQPPVYAPAQRVWFEAKALELASQLFFQPAGGELFCSRALRSGRERVERAQAILRRELREPPSLEELARLVGCSASYLSRQFSQEVGFTIQQYLRGLRLERAAELLRTGQCNVTEAAIEVGYNSLSHFSTAFHETFGCCPGLYPLKLPAQRAAARGTQHDSFKPSGLA